MIDMMMRMSTLAQFVTTATISTAILPTPEAHVVTTNDMQRWIDTFTAQGPQWTKLLRIVRAHLASPVVPVASTTTAFSAFEIPILSATTTTVLRAPELFIAPKVPIPLEMFYVIVPAEIPVDATLALIENNRKRKRGKRLQKISDGSNSSGLKILVTTTIPCVHDSLLAPAMTSRFPSISSLVMVPPTFVPDFANQTPLIVQPLQKFQQAQGNIDSIHRGRSRDSIRDRLS
ncbi:hypothetical protein Scep_001571 [Stephania cephalantha]|uniref:Uncharacterized protein n=1 Tax=Stephania cephalantha TaxID=152367 RepID=A0AAP0LB18_9MAGN